MATEPKAEHGSAQAIYYDGCSCDICRNKEKAIDRLVNGFSYINWEWAKAAMKEQNDECYNWPMWSTLFIPKDSADTRMITALLEPLKCTCNDKENCECDNGNFNNSGWQAVGKTGIMGREFDGELLLGINGAGYSFNAEHWSKLYDALGYHWHN